MSIKREGYFTIFSCNLFLPSLTRSLLDTGVLGLRTSSGTVMYTAHSYILLLVPNNTPT